MNETLKRAPVTTGYDIVGKDWNITLTRENKPINLVSPESHIQVTIEFIGHLAGGITMIDSWRVNNPKLRAYTYY